ncbi:MAG: hypothetical protein AAB250_03245, partial [Bdellovibrionota bacterium]
MIEKLRRKFANQMGRISADEIGKIKSLVLSVSDSKSPIVGEWIMSSLSRLHPEVLQELIRKGAGLATIAEWQLKGLESAPDFEGARKDLLRTLESGDAAAAKVVNGELLRKEQLSEKFFEGKIGAALLDLVYSPSVLESMVSRAYTSWIKNPQIWLRRVPDGRTYLEACLDGKALGSDSVGLLLKIIKEARLEEGDRVFKKFAATFFATADLKTPSASDIKTIEAMPMDELKWALDKIMRIEMGEASTVFGRFGTTSTLIQTIIATKDKNKIPAIFTVAREVLRSQVVTGSEKPELVRFALLRMVAQTKITHFFTPETQVIHERARFALIEEFGGDQKYEIVEDV